ncbi:MAG: tetratricopeptide (TPR) repeat protein [Roseivirga sp.]|jgi:tetratricopeptide (TPR) repeat protein
MKLKLLFLLALIASCAPEQESAKDLTVKSNFEAISLLGDTLIAIPPGQKAIDNYLERKANFEADPSADNWVWYGRFTAYQGNYNKAIDEYSLAIEKFPNDARFYRHRGHRYISIRQFDKAIADFEKAAELREGSTNEIEPDGAPNAQNIPVSTLDGNIFYHLGLAYYLNGDLEPALAAYKKAIAASRMDDNIVSGTHWVYMILRRMGKEEEALKALDVINKDMEIIENYAYYDLCLFYKGELSLEELTKAGEGELSSNDAVNYGIGNWYLYNGDEPKAGEIYESILTQPVWASFGYIAAEADVYRLSGNQ